MNETSFFLSKHCNEIIERETEKDWMDENIKLTIDASWKGSYKKKLNDITKIDLRKKNER